ncbi:D-glycero-beta-D-manno-heptose 1-phosphate adenylyltransferase [Candidatus Desantisbacteria bacterium]|nr:D-glycero-beta-D-manno-heptose 1-phosphate adenylyltransferase [Candidatus Desantisbacteria bacterium]
MSEKIKDLSELKQIVDMLKGQDKRIVFTNGCFDILHAGHVKYLQEAKNLGDVLVIGLNTDWSVCANKGPSRPLVGEQDRAEVLAALSCVDYIVMFDEFTPEKLIEKIVPNILVKGGDYEIDDIKGRECVEANNGRVVAIPFIPDKSTSNLIKLIVERYGR